MEFIENIFNQINDPFVAYVLLFLSAFTENLLPPIPGDTVVLIGAYLVSIDQLDFWGVYVATSLGSWIGFIVIYFFGFKFGHRFMKHRITIKLFKDKYIDKVKLWFSKWGYYVIFANRFLSGTRSVISLFAGLFHLNPYFVSGLSLISALIWHGALITAGILVGKNWQIIITVITRYNQVVIILLLIVCIVFILYKKRRRAVK